jgi:ADP-heptose:LPS heptosyltransferase
MNKYLLFRTDRIGDFLVSAILIKCIKINDPSANITVVASNKNSNYIQTFPYVDQVIQLNNNFLSKLNVFFKLFKFRYKAIIIHDDKKRSKLISFFLRSINKINIANSNEITHIQIINDILQKIKINYYHDALNILSHIKNKKFNKNDYIQLHFDEKWIFNNYIEKYVNIEPVEIELINFIKELTKKKDKKLIITTGVNLPNIIKKIKPKLDELKVDLYEGLDFTQLKKITVNSSTLISCHGAISHIAAAKNIKQIDIIDKSYNYSKWTSHFRNYKFLYRDKFDKLSNEIIDLL